MDFPVPACSQLFFHDFSFRRRYPEYRKAQTTSNPYYEGASGRRIRFTRRRGRNTFVSLCFVKDADSSFWILFHRPCPGAPALKPGGWIKKSSSGSLLTASCFILRAAVRGAFSGERFSAAPFHFKGAHSKHNLPIGREGGLWPFSVYSTCSKRRLVLLIPSQRSDLHACAFKKREQHDPY